MSRYIFAAMTALVLTLPAMGQADDGDSSARVAKARVQRTDQILTGHQGKINELELQMQTLLGEFETIKGQNAELADENARLRQQLAEAEAAPAPAPVVSDGLSTLC